MHENVPMSWSVWPGIQQQGLDHWVRVVVLVNKGIFRIPNKCHIDARHPTKMVDGLKFQRQDSHRQFWLLETMIRLVAQVEEVKVVYNPDGIYIVPSLSGVRKYDWVHNLLWTYMYQVLCACGPAKITWLPSPTNKQSTKCVNSMVFFKSGLRGRWWVYCRADPWSTWWFAGWRRTRARWRRIVI